MLPAELGFCVVSIKTVDDQYLRGGYAELTDCEGS